MIASFMNKSQDRGLSKNSRVTEFQSWLEHIAMESIFVICSVWNQLQLYTDDMLKHVFMTSFFIWWFFELVAVQSSS